MLARTQPGDGVNHCRGATNKTKQQQGRAGILRRFRRAGKGPHKQLLLFTSGLMEKEPFFFFSLFPEWQFYPAGMPSTSVRNPESHTHLKSGTPLSEIFRHQQHIKPSLKSTSWRRDAQLCVYVVNKLGCEQYQQ